MLDQVASASVQLSSGFGLILLTFSTALGVVFVLLSCACCRAKKSSAHLHNGNGESVGFRKIGNGADSSQDVQADGYHKIVDRRADPLPQPHVSLNRALPAVPCRQPNGIGEGKDVCLTRESSISELYATVDKTVTVETKVIATVTAQNHHGYSSIDEYSNNSAGLGKNVSVLHVNDSTSTQQPVVNRQSLVTPPPLAQESNQLYAPVTKSGATGSHKSLHGTTVIVGGDEELAPSEPLYNRIDGEPSISEDPYSSIKGDDSESDPFYSKVGDNDTSADVYGVHRSNGPPVLPTIDQPSDVYDPLYCQVDDWPKPVVDSSRPSSYVGPPVAQTSPRPPHGISPKVHLYAKVHRTSSDKHLLNNEVKLPVRREHEYSVIKKYDTEPNVNSSVQSSGKVHLHNGVSAGVLRQTARQIPPSHQQSADQQSTSWNGHPMSASVGYADVPELVGRQGEMASSVTAPVVEPSYKFITVRESLEALRARIEQTTANHNGGFGGNITTEERPSNGFARPNGQSEPVHHYYSTISEHNYELVNDRRSDAAVVPNDNSSLLYEQLPYDRDPIIGSTDFDDRSSLQYMDCYYATPSHVKPNGLKDSMGLRQSSDDPGSSSRLVAPCVPSSLDSDRHYSGIGQPVPIFRPVFEESDLNLNTTENGSRDISSSPDRTPPTPLNRGVPKTPATEVGRQQPSEHRSGDSDYLPSESSHSASFSSHQQSHSHSARGMGDGECEEDLDCFCHGKQRQYYL